mgnify:CR=1 FL=1
MAGRFSLWWSNGEHDDLIWHVHDSGGRATRRAAKGKSTKNAHGDLCATDHAVQPFFDLFVVEIKRGYPDATVHALLDQSRAAKEQTYTAWVAQAAESSKAAKTPYWMLIHRRDRRQVLVVVPDAFAADLEKHANVSLEDLEQEGHPVCRLYCPSTHLSYLWIVLLDNFLNHVLPEHIAALHAGRSHR